MTNSYYSLGYRPDIEGLRAIAILIVIFCHAGVPGFSAGFIGVDLFFVLSGYLISGLLIEEFSREGRIDFLKFYVRRLQRLAPALLTMLLVSSVTLHLLVAPAEQGTHFVSAAMAALWLSNIHFSLGAVEYFAADTGKNLFLHTWSLSVEEQFYLLWPVVIVLTMKFASARSGSNVTKRLCASFSLVMASSFALCLYLTYNNELLAYYLPVSRAWQFSAGALTLLLTSGLGRGFAGAVGNFDDHKSRIGAAAGWMGLTIVLVSATAVSEDAFYPGFWSLAPTAGAVLLLVSGTFSSRLGVARILSFRPLVHIGNISYGWYLWHWPALALAKIIYPEMTALTTVSAIGLAYLLALLSFRLIEMPVRHHRYLIGRPRLAGSMALSTMALTVACQLWLMQGSQVDVLSPELDGVYAARNDLPLIYAMECDDWTASSDLKKCEFGSDSATHEAILIGDSVAGQWFSAFAAIADRPEWRFTVFTKSACPLIDQPVYYARIGRRFENCEVWRNKLLLEIASRRPQVLLIGSSDAYAYSLREWEEGTARILQRVANNANQVVLIRSTPVLSFDMLSCAGNQIWQQLRLPFNAVSDCSSAHRVENAERVYGALQAAASHYGNVETVDLNGLVCPGETCSPRLGQTYTFRDKQHLTDSFVKMISPQAISLAGLN